MRNPLFATACFLGAVFVIDSAVLPTLAGWMGGFPIDQLRLTALAVIVVALLRSRFEAQGFAALMALLVGSLSGPGALGATLVSFIVTAQLAWMSRQAFHVAGWGGRFVLLYVFALCESLVFSGTRLFFWGGHSLDVQWVEHLVAVPLMLIYYALTVSTQRHRAAPPTPIGSRRQNYTL